MKREENKWNGARKARDRMYRIKYDPPVYHCDLKNLPYEEKGGSRKRGGIGE